MAKVSTSDFRNGLNIILDGEIYTITEFQHVKPGKGPAFVRTKLKGVENEKNIDKTFRSGESVESIRVERQTYQFLYAEGNMFFFMHQETYEQIPLERSRVENSKFITDGMLCTLVVDVDNEKILYAEPPDQVESEVIDTDPGVKGDTAQGGSKPATISGGATVQVPLFIEKGEKIRVDTRTGDYLERAKN